MSGAGSALMGIGHARGDGRASAAAEMAVSSPLLEASIEGARGVLLSISGGSDLGLFEIHEAAGLVQQAAHPDANIIFGAVIDDALGDEVRVTVIAAGFDGGEPKPRTKPFRGVEDLPAPAQALTPAVDNASGVQDTGSHAPVPAAEQAPESVQLPNEPARVRRPIVFDDTSLSEDDLDVPDFLK
jgi:cell division protein FtsZ